MKKTVIRNAKTILNDVLNESYTLKKEETGIKFAKKVKKSLKSKNIPNEEISIWYNLFNIPLVSGGNFDTLTVYNKHFKEINEFFNNTNISVVASEIIIPYILLCRLY